jgi:hypothetical protein
LKITFTADGERDIPVIRGSSFNLIVTNTEKIRIQARPVRANRWGYRQLQAIQEDAREEANLRLQAIASLPHLGVFSDEAHHTYGNALGTELKRVRQTVDYLARATNVIAVVNTTGTPYFKRQPLRDVVIWYGLRAGIEDGILKEVADNIRSYTFESDQADEFVSEVVGDFFRDYGDHVLPDGSPARLAIYFPQMRDLDDLAPHIELALTRAGQPPTTILRNTMSSSVAEIDAFNRLNDPSSPHRVILLVNKGTEGWNCPSLFATALARRLRTSNNFVLQAASRCLRQVPGNDRAARIYLSDENRSILDRQLQETYGETLADLDRRTRATRRAKLRLRKRDLPRIRLKRAVIRLIRNGASTDALVLTRPPLTAPSLTVATYSIGIRAATRNVLRQTSDAVTIEPAVDTIDAATAASELAAVYRLDVWPVLDAIRAAYIDGFVPVADLEPLSRQIEEGLGDYQQVVDEEAVELAIAKPEGWARETLDGEDIFTTDFSYPADREHLVWGLHRIAENAGDYGYHYVPYNFDSGPESDFYEKVVRELNVRPGDVQDIYFTGAITDRRKTDLVFAYADPQRERTRDYTPDFVIHATGDRWLLVEIKMTARRLDPIEGETGAKANALRELQAANAGRIFYRIVFADTVVGHRDVEAIRAFAEGEDDA